MCVAALTAVRYRRDTRHDLYKRRKGGARRAAQDTGDTGAENVDQDDGEERELKESPKVATYDLEPKLAAEPVADAMARRCA